MDGKIMIVSIDEKEGNDEMTGMSSILKLDFQPHPLHPTSHNCQAYNSRDKVKLQDGVYPYGR
jgi:hypothetical protein